MPSRVGQYFDEAYELLRYVGFTEMAVFDKRVRTHGSFLNCLSPTSHSGVESKDLQARICSRKIFIPIAINISPPIISTLFPSLSPADFPILIAVIEARKVTAPIRIPASQIFTSRRAKLIPTANASILVPRANVKRTIVLLKSFVPSSLVFLSPSYNHFNSQEMKAIPKQSSDLLLLSAFEIIDPRKYPATVSPP